MIKPQKFEKFYVKKPNPEKLNTKEKKDKETEDQANTSSKTNATIQSILKKVGLKKSNSEEQNLEEKKAKAKEKQDQQANISSKIHATIQTILKKIGLKKQNLEEADLEESNLEELKSEESNLEKLKSEEPDLETSNSEELLPEEKKAKEKRFSCLLESVQQATISSEIRATVHKIFKKMGDDVQQGDVLVILDQEHYQAEHKKALADLQLKKQNFIALKELYKDKIATKLEYIQAKASLKSSNANVKKAKKMLNDTVISAPFSGKLVTMHIKENELAEVGSKILDLVNNNVLKAKLLLPSRYHDKVKEGTFVTIKMTEMQDPILATISHISPIIDPSSSTFLLEADIKNVDNKLKSGMSGWAKITKEKTS